MSHPAIHAMSQISTATALLRAIGSVQSWTAWPVFQSARSLPKSMPLKKLTLRIERIALIIPAPNCKSNLTYQLERERRFLSGRND